MPRFLFLDVDDRLNLDPKKPSPRDNSFVGTVAYNIDNIDRVLIDKVGNGTRVMVQSRGMPVAHSMLTEIEPNIIRAQLLRLSETPSAGS